MNTNKQSQSGAVLVAVIIGLVAAAFAGVALLSVATSARQERITLSVANRAYYLAESGAAYVRARVEEEFDYPPYEGHPPITNTFDNGDQFIVTAYRTNVTRVVTNASITNISSSVHVMATSVGVVNPGRALEARQEIFFDIFSRGISGERLDELQQSLVLFEGDTGSPDYRDELWDETGFSKVEVKNTGPSRGIALVPKVDKGEMQGRLALSWQDDPRLTDSMMRVYRAKNYLLGYDMQVKLAYFPNVPTTHLMMGLSFRLHEDTDESYGLSFFRSDPAATNRDLERDAPWVLDLDANFRTLRDTNFYLTLWYRSGAGETIQLINHQRIPDAFLFEYKGGRELSYYNTMLVQLREAYDSSSATGRINKIAAYLAHTNTYPVWPDYFSTNALWQDSATAFPAATHAPVVWSGPPVSPASGDTITNIDRRVTSAGFMEDPNAEFGIHLFYDRNSDNETFFRDFTIRFDVEGVPFRGTQIQW